MSCCAVRPEPAFHLATLNKILHQDVVEPKLVAKEEHCKGVQDEVECLERRTLVAHLDYIIPKIKIPRTKVTIFSI
ncbi:hypothetical protein A4A49_34979 [Nicotiana attenuata]|uniref:Phytosulfokine n=1 Tax=Nicotiana attenuata TaxID=49451 RepID=A0A1J6KCR8_NICAT|nr:hypothetical protein A4A49_34979 [Nicotiana attenuata]